MHELPERGTFSSLSLLSRRVRSQNVRLGLGIAGPRIGWALFGRSSLNAVTGELYSATRHC